MKGQELPGWAYIVGLIIGLFALIFIIWLSLKSGKTGAELLLPFG